MAKSTWQTLWENYQRERRKLIREEAFLVLLQVFPAILVAQADGFTDTSEVQRLEEVVRFLCQENPDLEAALDWRSEMRYLAIDADYWRGPFIEALRAYLAHYPAKYFQQAEFLYATAAASTGDIMKNLLLNMQKNIASVREELISEKEKIEIERLIGELGFQGQAEALSYLRGLIAPSHG